MTAFEWLSKVRFDPKENPSEYMVAYHDRVKDKNIEIPLSDISNVDQLAFVLGKGADEVEVPMHRVRRIYKKGLLLWKREKEGWIVSRQFEKGMEAQLEKVNKNE